jgi:hypothetical protein
MCVPADATSQGSNIMTRRVDFRRSISVVLALFGLFQFTARAASEGKSAATARADEESPLIARAPAKPTPGNYDLRYKLRRGEVLRYEVTHSASIRSTIDSTTQEAQTKTDSLKLWKVTDVLPGGEIEFMNVVERVHMVNQLPDGKSAEYDSARDKTPPPGFEDAARSVGVPLSVVRITARGDVVRRDAKLSGQNVDEDAPIATRLPEKPVAIGDTWNELYDLQVALENGSAKAIQTRRHYKLAAVANGIATIEVSYQVLSPIDAHIECQLVQRLMEGEVRFDMKAGRVVSQNMNVDKRILGFAGPSSSMQYIMRMEEKLVQSGRKVAGKPARNATATPRGTSRTKKTQTADRPRGKQRNRTSR